MFMTKKGKDMRDDPLFLRNSDDMTGLWDIPLVKKQMLPFKEIDLIASCETRKNDSIANRKKGIHHFVDDYRFFVTYNKPGNCIEKYKQYAFALTPDFSLYLDMPLWMQLQNVAKNRWVGTYWQSRGIIAIPTISWSSSKSFNFCFEGVEKNSIVAISTIGCYSSRTNFLKGYDAMLEHINPEAIICYGKPFSSMHGNLIVVEYHNFKRRLN